MRLWDRGKRWIRTSILSFARITSAVATARPGPSSISPETNKPYGASFPHVSAADIVDTQVQLLDHFEIDRLHAVIGPSIGGLLCLTLATLYPDRVKMVASLGSALEISALQRIVIFETGVGD